jgi:hypothetical protein
VNTNKWAVTSFIAILFDAEHIIFVFSKVILKNFLLLAAEQFFSKNLRLKNSPSLEERRTLSSEND